MEELSVQEMKIKSNKLTDECQDNGAKTMNELDKQGKQLEQTEKQLDGIKENVKKVQENLNELSKCCGLCLCPCNRLKSIKNNRRYKQVWSTEQKDGDVITSQVTSVRNKQGVSVQSAAPPLPYIKRIINDAREDEMERNLNHVGSAIGNLKNMAKDMGNEFDKQNKTIDRITEKVVVNTDHVEDATKKVKKLIK